MSVSPTYNLCAVEGKTCTFQPGQGLQSVAFATGTPGLGSVFFRQSVIDVPCNSKPFGGDPAVGHLKNCYNKSIPLDIVYPAPDFYDSNNNPAGWTQCADENNPCVPKDSNGQPIVQPVDILYGANKSYMYANAVSTPCDSTTLGDPIIGTPKACWWRYPLVPPSPPPIPSPTGPTAPITPAPITPAPTIPPPKPFYKNPIFWIIIILLVIIIIVIIVLIKHKKAAENE
jgi:hypothetical protein